MYINTDTDMIIRDLDSVKCTIRNPETDEPEQYSISDLTADELKYVLDRCEPGQLHDIEYELMNSVRTVLLNEHEKLLDDSAGITDYRMMITALAGVLREFGDTLGLEYPADYDWMVNGSCADYDQDDVAEPRPNDGTEDNP